MVVPAAKVRALCTSSEASLVRLSRKAELARLHRAEVKKLAARARTLRDKWREAGRRQAVAGKSKQPAATNSQVKEEIIREAQERFEARLTELEKKDAVPKATRRETITKLRRNAEHRAKRAAVRKGMSAAEDLLNTAPRKAKPAATARKAKRS
jgi:hypothetical protein